MSNDMSVVPAAVIPFQGDYAEYSRYMARIVALLHDKPGYALILGRDFCILSEKGSLMAGCLLPCGYPDWEGRCDVDVSAWEPGWNSWEPTWKALLDEQLPAPTFLLYPGPEAPFEASVAQYEAYADRLRRLVQARPGKALLVGCEFYLVAADGALQVGEVGSDDALDMESLLTASAGAWAPHYKHELDEALASPRYAPLPEPEPVNPHEPIAQLQSLGCCVVVFTAEELRGADPRKVQDRLVELGWEVIDCLA